MKPAAALSALSAALGICIAFGSGGAVRLAGVAVGILGMLSAVLCLIALRRKRRSILSLRRQMSEFLEGRIQSPAFSVNDDDHALLENAVVELETRLLLERENTRRMGRRNADFIADVSHQLKTPLAGLKLYCELDGVGGGRADKRLALIERMEGLVASLLRLEKLRADAYEMKFSPASLHTIAVEARRALLEIYPDKRIDVSGDALLRCDADWMGEAISNIVKNACEHTAPAGSVAITVEQSDASVSVTVEDDGGGVAQDALPALFERFSRGAAAKPGGAGLGLPIARTIAEKHHGTAFAENGPNGLRVILCFPVLDGLKPL